MQETGSNPIPSIPKIIAEAGLSCKSFKIETTIIRYGFESQTSSGQII
ncbi:MAG: hypothetical protein R2685_02015 [Candidatus Nitrosocosmicus sp.]|nr:hypothetical protein [Candidatus Nitrosocosmicus sp.]